MPRQSPSKTRRQKTAASRQNKRWHTSNRKQALTAFGQHLTVITLCIHLGFIAIVYVTHESAPPQSALPEMLWGHHNRPFIKAFIGWLILSITTTLLAISVPGKHRLYLLLIWITSLPSLWLYNGDRLNTAIRVIWHHVLN